MACGIKLLLLGIALAQITCTFSNQHVCPNMEVKENITDLFIFQKLKRSVTHGVWKSPQLSQQSKLGAELRDIILEMVDSDSFYFTNFASLFTGWTTSLLAEAHHYYPNLCIFASIINKTVEWKRTGDVLRYIESLNDTVEAVTYAASFLTHATLVELDCKNISEPNACKEGCWQNGLVSSQSEIWETFGRLMPWPLRAVHSLLVNSPLFIDRAYATMLSFILTPAQNYVTTHKKNPFLTEFGKHYLYAANTSKCCCDEWASRLDELGEIYHETVEESVNEKIEEIRNEC